MTKQGLIFALVVTFCSAGYAQEIKTKAQNTDDLVGAPLSRGAGAWKTRAQQLFEPSSRSLIRKTFTVWQSIPQGDLEFEWVPGRVTEVSDGRVSGTGRLIWRDKTRPSYDDTAVVAEYRGEVADGKMQGVGRYINRNGLSYEGQWANGLMNGKGRLQLPDGTEYEGQFRNGLAEGAGRLVDTTGERFEGDFKAGQRSGFGTTVLPNGRSYPSRWVDGRENDRSRLIRIAQSGGRLPGGDDIRIGIGVDQKLPPIGYGDKLDASDLAYQVINDPTAFRIRPSNKRLMDMWLAKGDLQLTWEEEGQSGEGVVSVGKTQIVPLKLRVEVQNKSSSPAQLAGLYLDVDKSTAERKPALQIGTGGIHGCGEIGYLPRFRIENFGWAKAEAAKMRLATTQTSGSSSFSYGQAIGDIDKRTDVDLEPTLKSAGVDTAYFASLQDGFPCVAKDKASGAACLKRLQASGKLGKISNAVDVKDTSFFARLSGNLDYSWHDSAGEHDWSNPFNAIIPLGHFKIEAECGEGGRPQIVVNKTQQFKLDQSGYRIPISFQTTVPPGQKSILLIPIEALQSSSHAFKVVLQFTNGSEVSSRPIELLYYRPSWFKEDAEQGAADNDVVWIYNRELIGTELRRLQTSDPDECRKACDEQSACLGYSLNRDARVCSLKSSVTAKRLDAAYESLLKKGPQPPESSSAKTMEVRRSVSLGSSDTAYLIQVDSNAEDCQRLCMADDQCVSFDFGSNLRLCNLMTGLGEPKNDPNSVSGIKHQPNP